MTTLNTTEDLLRAARENQEFREAFRREILTDDLINLPQRFEAHTQRFEAYASETSKNINALTVSITELTKSLDSMNRNLGEKLDRLAVSHRMEHNALLHRFKGNYAIETTRDNDGDIAEKFADARGVDSYRLRTLTRDERDDLFDENLDGIDLLATEGNISKTFPAGDIIAEVSDRRSRDTIFYVAVEASYTVDAKDVMGASDNAKILREATGHEAFAIVSGVEINSEIGDEYRLRIIFDLTEYLESRQEDVVFWFRLEDSSLEPPP